MAVTNASGQWGAHTCFAQLVVTGGTGLGEAVALAVLEVGAARGSSK